MLTVYTPEMNEARPANTQIDATMSYRGACHWHLKTPIALSGRGVKFTGVLLACELTDAAKHKAGWNTYTVTAAAFEKIKATYRVSCESLLS